MFIQELDRPAYLIVEKRGFFDKELGVTPQQIAELKKLQDRANMLQLWLREVYHAGDNSHKVEAPPWLVELSERKQDAQVSDPGSSKTLRLTPKQTASSSSTK